jgi:hypothetical protein
MHGVHAALLLLGPLRYWPQLAIWLRQCSSHPHSVSNLLLAGGPIPRGQGPRYHPSHKVGRALRVEIQSCSKLHHLHATRHAHQVHTHAEFDALFSS